MGISINTSRTAGASRSSHWARRALGGGLLCALGVLLFVGPAMGREGDAHGGLVPAVLSPYDSPECATAGLSTLIVPTEAGVLDDALATGEPVDIPALLGTATTPTLVFCGQVTATQEDETECDLDELLSVLVPDDGSGGSTSPFGSAIDAMRDASPEAAKSLGEALGCTSPAPDQGTPDTTTPAAPPATQSPGVATPAPRIPAVSRAPSASRPAEPSTAVSSTDGSQSGGTSQVALPLIPASSADGSGPVVAALACLVGGALWMAARRSPLPSAQPAPRRGT
jgi:hypothetical protein